MSKPKDFWSSPTGFILATIGAAVGLGSIWKFPYEVGANGGAGCRSRIELLRLALHIGNLLPDSIETQVLDQPNGSAGKEIGDMLRRRVLRRVMPFLS